MSGRQYMSMTHSRMNPAANLFESRMTASPGAQQSIEVKLDLESMETARSKESVVRMKNRGAPPVKTTNSLRPATMYKSTNFATANASNIRESGDRKVVYATLEKDEVNQSDSANPADIGGPGDSLAVQLLRNFALKQPRGRT